MMSSFSSHTHPVERLLDEAIAALRRGDAAAMAAGRRATELAPQRLDGWWLYGTAAQEAWSFGTAEKAFGEGVARAKPGSPRQASFFTHRGRALSSLGRNAEAKAAAEAALAIGIHDGPSLNIIGVILQQAGCLSEALDVLQRAVTLAPDIADTWYNLGTVQQFNGDLAGAEASYEKAIAIAGPYTSAHLSLARLKRWNRDNNHIERLKRLPVQMPGDAARFGYALFKEYDDIGDTAAAWAALQKAARAARDQPVPAEAGAWGAQDEPRSTTRIGAWTSIDDLRVVEAWRTYLPKERFVGLAPRPHAGPRRIFIVGLPRSGTTLVERVLTAHSQVQAQGELLTFPLGVKYMSGSTTGPLLDVDTVAAAAKLDPQVLTDYYLRETTYLNDGSAYAIDKLPANHSYVGLIRLAFPDAIIVHVRRNPMDSLFGAYKLLFAYSYRWSYSQDDLAEHYANYRLLMDHWKACLGDGIIDVSLEAVIAEPETQIRRLLVACGLPFEAACLNPHEAAGPVATASSVQVRSPINAEGVGAWRRYADQLGPLKQRLISMGVIDSDGNAIE